MKHQLTFLRHTLAELRPVGPMPGRGFRCEVFQVAMDIRWAIR